jgi:membrane dipeptidase
LRAGFSFVTVYYNRKKKEWCFLKIIDAHCDSILDVLHERRHLGDVGHAGQADFISLKEAGVKLQFFAVFIESIYKPDKAVLRALEGIEVFHRELEHNAHLVTLVKSRDDLNRLSEDQRLGALLTVEGGEALGGQLSMVSTLYRLGVRSIGLTWNQGNDLADGVGVGEKHQGLTKFGEEVVKEMNRLGMLVDLAHIGEKGFWDVLEVSESPVIVTHANCQGLCPHPRNLNDEQLKALAAQGGCLGITFVPDFIDAVNPNLDRLVDHIDYAVQIMGIEHVGLGSDFDGMDTRIPGLETTSDLPALIAKLRERGYSEEDVNKLAWGNWDRILNQCLPKEN